LKAYQVEKEIMRNLKGRLENLEKERDNLIPPEPVKVFLDPVECAEYLKMNPGATAVLLRAVDFRKKNTMEVAP